MYFEYARGRREGEEQASAGSIRLGTSTQGFSIR
jgi:hypothetical protein